MKATNAANWILITGTSTGIGRAATFTLAEHGYRVLAAVRKQDDIESLLAEAAARGLKGSVEPIILDVTDAGQIAAAVDIVNAKIAAGGRLHAVVHNAGAQTAGPIETMPLDAWRSQFEVLFFGPVALTQQLLPQLRASRGRVINVTSIGGIMPGPMIAAYQAAKAALEAVSDSMRIEFSPFGVHVCAIAPGGISTPMLDRSPDQLNRLADALPKSLQPLYADALRAYAKTVASAQRASTSPAKASLTILRAVTASRPKTRYLIGTDAKLGAFLKHNLPDRWMDAITFRLVGLPRRVPLQP
ncbi:MAG TPA: SDR family NAD(P)-dependent oxidoreductase [Alphaproteobacteria bacterium]|nr:SDR family NAD(P)-dependent oxidoreductase [Alphaproteobacteria bacterium]